MEMNLHIPVSTFEFIDESDNHFLKVRLQAIAEGENLNRSSFSKDGMEKYKDTFRGKPLLCAFPKDKYANEYKIGDGHNSSDIKYDAEYNEFYHSYLDPNSERMVGYIPFNSNITCELIDGKNWICMDALILRKYNYELVKDILEKKKGKSVRDNKRISVEIEVLKSHTVLNENDDYEVEMIDEFKGMGVTILFDDTQEAIVGANLKAFSESEQYNKFKSFMKFNFEENQYIDDNEIGTGERVSIKRDKVSDTSWGDIDKTELYKKAMKASNYKTLVKFIYAKIEDGWEENPSSKLKYPIAEISDDEALYNKNGLIAALRFSKGENDDAVTKKVIRIMKRLDLYEDKKDEYATEKNKDTIDNKTIVEKYPDILEMEERRTDVKEDFSLTMNQKREIVSSSLSEYKYGKNDYCKYWVYDIDDDYVYVQDCEFDKLYRVKYVMDEDSKTAIVDIDSKEEVIRGGYEVVGEKGDGEMEMEEKKEDIKLEEEFEEEKLEHSEDEDVKEKTSLEFEAKECLDEVKEKFSVENAKIICQADDYVLYSLDEKIYASKIDNAEEKFEVSASMNFDVTKIEAGGVQDAEPLSIPVKVVYSEELINLMKDNECLKSNAVESDKKMAELQGKLDEYKCNELLSKFEEISFESNITVSEKAEWKSRISKNEFSCEEDLVEKFGGFVFKKNMDNKRNVYSSEVITEKVKTKNSVETLIDRYTK